MKMEQKHVVAFGLIILAIFSRLIPHPMNFTPLIALAIFSASVFSNKTIALLVPLTALIVSDLLIGLHSLSLLVYFSFALIGLMSFALNKKHSAKSILLTGTLGSFVFFMVSNFGVWVSTALYAKSFSGLVECYVAALPFFHNTLASTYVYSFALFGSLAFFKNNNLSVFVKSKGWQ